MFTSIDKAIVAFIMALIYIINFFFGTSIGVDPTTVALVAAAATPVLVWLIPNKRR